MRYHLLLLALLLPLVATGCGGAVAARRVPDVRGQRLDLAEERLQARGLDFEEVGGGTFGVVARDGWPVCAQVPRAGRRSRTVRLVVARECPYEEEEQARRPAPLPRVVGLRVAPALARLRQRGATVEAFTRRGARVERGRWVVCSQWPATRRPVRYVQLTVARRCRVR